MYTPFQLIGAIKDTFRSKVGIIRPSEASGFRQYLYRTHNIVDPTGPIKHLIGENNVSETTEAKEWTWIATADITSRWYCN